MRLNWGRIPASHFSTHCPTWTWRYKGVTQLFPIYFDLAKRLHLHNICAEQPWVPTFMLPVFGTTSLVLASHVPKSIPHARS